MSLAWTRVWLAAAALWLTSTVASLVAGANDTELLTAVLSMLVAGPIAWALALRYRRLYLASPTSRYEHERRQVAFRVAAYVVIGLVLILGIVIGSTRRAAEDQGDDLPLTSVFPLVQVLSGRPSS